ncbi:MAG: indolepyruvate ferredoxin oxidoreductase subunit alpha [bacterium]
MNPIELLQDSEGKELFLLGNEAIVRGALEAGVGFASTYPGTPSTEIGDVLSEIALKAGMYFEFSVNEKVALEVAAAAAASGVRTLVFMKHVGLNVAADPLVTTAHIGVRAGMVINTADDPSTHSSQNEQDNRYYAQLAGLPMLEPANPDEAKEMTRAGFEISEKLGIPLLLRTTTRVAHIRGIVKLGRLTPIRMKGEFKKDPARFVPVPDNAKKMHQRLLETLEEARKMAEESPFNRLIAGSVKSGTGIIASGPAYNYVADFVRENDLQVPILKLGFTWPFPREIVLDFIRPLQTLFIAEELEPFLEKEVRALAQMEQLSVTISGKMSGPFSRALEFSPDVVREGLGKHFSVPGGKIPLSAKELPLAPRPPVFCPGCPHRATYVEVGMALRRLKIKNAVFPSDIGCYTLGIAPPYVMADYLLCMGSSTSTSCGFSQATEQPVICFLGDSTFFHTGMAGLINAHHNGHHYLAVILDNRTTAMTGNQPHPGLPHDGMGREAPALDIVAMVKAMGIPFVERINPYRYKESIEHIVSALKQPGVSVLVAEGECALIRDRRKRREGDWTHCLVREDRCVRCHTCVNFTACPALLVGDDKKVAINEHFCNGCALCLQICPKAAIEAIETRTK